MPTCLDEVESSETTWQNDSQPAQISILDSDMRTKIQTLENHILKSRRHYNDISILLGYVRDQQRKSNKDILAAVALGRIFTQLLASNNMSAPVGAPESEIMVVQWLTQRYEDYKLELLKLITSPYIDKSLTALTLIMQLIKEDALQRKPTEDISWRKGPFPQLLILLVSAANIEDVKMKYIDEYLKIYDDVRYFSFSLLA